jgi:hypothetical protein
MTQIFKDLVQQCQAKIEPEALDEHQPMQISETTYELLKKMGLCKFVDETGKERTLHDERVPVCMPARLMRRLGESAERLFSRSSDSFSDDKNILDEYRKRKEQSRIDSLCAAEAHILKLRKIAEKKTEQLRLSRSDRTQAQRVLEDAMKRFREASDAYQQTEMEKLKLDREIVTRQNLTQTERKKIRRYIGRDFNCPPPSDKAAILFASLAPPDSKSEIVWNDLERMSPSGKNIFDSRQDQVPTRTLTGNDKMFDD